MFTSYIHKVHLWLCTCSPVTPVVVHLCTTTTARQLDGHVRIIQKVLRWISSLLTVHKSHTHHHETLFPWCDCRRKRRRSDASGRVAFTYHEEVNRAVELRGLRKQLRACSLLDPHMHCFTFLRVVDVRRRAGPVSDANVKSTTDSSRLFQQRLHDFVCRPQRGSGSCQSERSKYLVTVTIQWLV